MYKRSLGAENRLSTGWWFGICLFFPHMLGIIIPTDYIILFRGVETTNQIHYYPKVLRRFKDLQTLRRGVTLRRACA